jgi:hypothetical protein
MLGTEDGDRGQEAAAILVRALVVVLPGTATLTLVFASERGTNLQTKPNIREHVSGAPPNRIITKKGRAPDLIAFYTNARLRPLDGGGQVDLHAIHGQKTVQNFSKNWGYYTSSLFFVSYTSWDQRAQSEWTHSDPAKCVGISRP